MLQSQGPIWAEFWNIDNDNQYPFCWSDQFSHLFFRFILTDKDSIWLGQRLISGC